MAAPELPRAKQRELEPQDTWRPRSCPGLAAGAGAAGHVAAPGWAAGARAAGHVAAPELARAVRFMLRLITRGSV
jgi:hypothetical protein